VRRSRPGRFQTSPQQYWVTSSCMSWLNSSAFLIALSTYSAPSTSRRVFRPLSNSSLFIPVSSVVPIGTAAGWRPSPDSSPAAEARPSTPESGHRPPLALPVPGAERLLVELAEPRDRQLVNELDRFRRRAAGRRRPSPPRPTSGRAPRSRPRPRPPDG